MCASRTATFRAGDDSLKFNIAVTDSERRGEAPSVKPLDVKRECANLLEKLRLDAVGLKPETEFHIESYFTVADAFEADGRLVQAVDYLSDLKRDYVRIIPQGDKYTYFDMIS